MKFFISCDTSLNMSFSCKTSVAILSTSSCIFNMSVSCSQLRLLGVFYVILTQILQNQAHCTQIAPVMQDTLRLAILHAQDVILTLLQTHEVTKSFSFCDVELDGHFVHVSTLTDNTCVKYVSSRQSTHCVLPGMSLNFPGAHVSQGPPFGPPKPWLQTHAMPDGLRLWWRQVGWT